MVSALDHLLVSAMRPRSAVCELQLAPWRTHRAAPGPYRPGDAGGINPPKPRKPTGMTPAKPEGDRTGRLPNLDEQDRRDQPASEQAAVPLYAFTPITLAHQSTVDLVALRWGQELADRHCADPDNSTRCSYFPCGSYPCIPRRVANQLITSSAAGWQRSWTARIDALTCGVPVVAGDAGGIAGGRCALPTLPRFLHEYAGRLQQVRVGSCPEEVTCVCST